MAKVAKKQQLFQLMFETWVSLNGWDMNDHEAIWSALMGNYECTFKKELSRENQDFCNEYFMGDVADCFYDKINSEATTNKDLFFSICDHFIEPYEMSVELRMTDMFGLQSALEALTIHPVKLSA